MRSTWVFLLTFSVIGLAILLSSVGLNSWVGILMVILFVGALVSAIAIGLIAEHVITWRVMDWMAQNGRPKNGPRS